MGLFSKIADRIFNRKDDDRPAPAPAAGKPAPVIFEGKASDPKVSPPARNPAPVASVTPTATPEPVDVEAVLRDMATARGGDSDWRRSIVDLLKLLDLDSSLAARRELAEELGVSAGAHGSAEQNIALHRAVMRKLAENGGKVPAELRD
jgi:8-oxo-dGTP pyrophosphatase MutT (NUDIX family)